MDEEGARIEWHEAFPNSDIAGVDGAERKQQLLLLVAQLHRLGLLVFVGTPTHPLGERDEGNVPGIGVGVTGILPVRFVRNRIVW